MSRARTLIEDQISVLVVHFYNEALWSIDHLLLVRRSYCEGKKPSVLSYFGSFIIFNDPKNHIDLTSIASNY
jgi:hypothetical protein